MDVQQAEAFAKEWIQAWNERDLEAILSHYAEDVEFFEREVPLMAIVQNRIGGLLR